VEWDEKTGEKLADPFRMARIILVVSNVRLAIWSPHPSSPADVIWSDGVKPCGFLPGPDRRHPLDTYESKTVQEPVIFSIAGTGAVAKLEPWSPLHSMIIYEWTVITGPGTTIHPITMDLYPEIRRLVDFTPSFDRPVAATVLSKAFMHSSHSFIQQHRLVVRTREGRLDVTIEDDPVLLFANATKTRVYVYTGTTAYRLAVFVNRRTGHLDCYCMRQTLHVDEHDGNMDHVTLSRLIACYGPLCPVLPIETLLFILMEWDSTTGFQWASVPLMSE